MVRRDVFNEIGLLDEDPRLIAGEDYDMLLRVSLKRKVDYINSSPLLIFRKRSDSISKGLLKQWHLSFFIANRYISYSGKSRYFKKIILLSLGLVRVLFYNLILSIKSANNEKDRKR